MIVAVLSVVGLFLILTIGQSQIQKWSKGKWLKKYEAQKNHIIPEKVLDNWSVMVEKAKGRRDALLDKLEKRIKEANVPNWSVEQKSVSVEGTYKQPFIALSSSSRALKGYEMLVGANDYGDRLNVMWYLVFDSPGDTVRRELIRTRREEEAAGANGLDKGYTRPEKLAMADKGELSNATSIVLNIVKDEVKKMADAFNLDFSKMDSKSKGFLNIS